MNNYSLQHLIDMSETCFDEVSALCADLSEPQWRAQSLCPAWTVREALAHTVGVEDVLCGWEISVEDMPPFQKMQALTDESSSMTAAQFQAKVEQIFAVRRSELAALTDDDIARPSFTPVGAQTYGDFLAIRVFDLWVHVRDCTIPLGRSTDDGGGAAEMTLDQVERSMGYIVGKLVGLPDAMSLRVDLTGPVQRQMAVIVDGRARAVAPESLDAPDVTLTADSTTFIMLACGRIDPQTKIDSGAISWTGDAEWGERAARSLRFTM